MIKVCTLRSTLALIKSLSQTTVQPDDCKGLLSVLEEIMPHGLEVQGKHVQKGSSSIKIGQNVDADIERCSNAAFECIWNATENHNEEDIVDFYTIQSNAFTAMPASTHEYTDMIIGKLKKLGIVPVRSQVRIVDLDARINTAIDVIGVSLGKKTKKLNSLTITTIETKTGYNQGTYGRSELKTDKCYGSLPVCTKTRHHMQLFYYWMWLYKTCQLKTKPLLMVVNDRTMCQKQLCKTEGMPAALNDPDSDASSCLFRAIRERTQLCSNCAIDIRSIFKSQEL